MTIVARSGLARRSLPSDAPAREHLHFIEKSGLRGGELANQMLAFSGQSKLDFQAVQLSKLIKDMSSFLRATVSKRLRLEYHLATSLPLIRADLAQLRQMIVNLVTQCLRSHWRRGGRYHLKYERTGSGNPGLPEMVYPWRFFTRPQFCDKNSGHRMRDEARHDSQNF